MRPAIARIDLDALRHNYRLARSLGGKALAVVKADAYGHGAVRCAQALEGEADAFAVAAIEEALELRDSGIRKPILLLEGFFEPSELELIAQHELWFAVASQWQLEALEAFDSPKPLHAWLKLDSGMHRLGFAPQEFRAAHARLSAMKSIASIVLMTHMARADEPECARSLEQLATFNAITQGLHGDTSVCNSPSLLGWPQLRGQPSQSTWGRPGLMLYGADPLPAGVQLPGELKPVMHVESEIIAVRELAAGEPVGYGAHFVTDKPMRVGVVAFGYADGYPQMAPNGTPVSIDGKPGRLIGRVSMDMLTVDLSDHPQAHVGSKVQLWGDAPRLSELAAASGTSAYQIPCALKRARRVYSE